MRSSYPRWALTGLAAVVFPAFSGCADHSRPEPLGPSSTTHDRALIQGVLSSGVQVLNRDGSAQTFRLPDFRFRAKLSNGIAAQSFVEHPHSVSEGLPALAAVVAVAAGSEKTARRDITFTDAAGRTHDIQVSEQGGRLVHTRHVIDGVLFAETSKRWSPRGNIWTLDGTEIVVHAKGRELRLNAQSSQRTIAQLDGTGQLNAVAGSSARAALSLFTPSEAYASSCLSAALNLAAASLAVATTAAAAVVDWPVLAVAIVWYASATADYADQCGPVDNV